MSLNTASTVSVMVTQGVVGGVAAANHGSDFVLHLFKPEEI